MAHVRRSRDIGTAAETAVVAYLRTHGWPHAERRALRGAHDAGDITGTPGICWEVKGGRAAEDAGDGLIDQWVHETARETLIAGASWGVLVLKRRGAGTAGVGRWWAIVPVSRLVLPDPEPAVVYAIDIPATGPTRTARLTLETLCAVLNRDGYGDTP